MSRKSKAEMHAERRDALIYEAELAARRGSRFNAVIGALIALSLHVLDFCVVPRWRAAPCSCPPCSKHPPAPTGVLPTPAPTPTPTPTPIPTPTLITVMPQEQARPMSRDEAAAHAERHLHAAAKLSGARGEGRRGWLELLAAFDFDPLAPSVVDNLVENYWSANYPDLAEDALLRVRALLSATDAAAATAAAAAAGDNTAGGDSHKLSRRIDALLAEAARRIARLPEYRRRSRRLLQHLRGCGADANAPGSACLAGELHEGPKGQSLSSSAVTNSSHHHMALGCPRMTLPFSTAVARWQLDAPLGGATARRRLNSELYTAAVAAYDRVLRASRAAGKSLTTTELNHALFRWQMAVLDKTGDYWDGFTKLPIFRPLMRSMQAAAAALLRAHGHSTEVARRKAAHDTIFWLSVHTIGSGPGGEAGGAGAGAGAQASMHEPHNTDDSRVGAVYYVSVPRGSGKLEIYDPRGKPPASAMDKGEAMQPPRPPFHRTLTVTPEEGLLVLFPGWLVHSVLPANKTAKTSVGASVGGSDSAKHEYRVSVSMNLKGEWQDTGNLVVDRVPLDVACVA